MATVTRREWDELIKDLEETAHKLIETGLVLKARDDEALYPLIRLIEAVQRATIFLKDWREEI